MFNSTHIGAIALASAFLCFATAKADAAVYDVTGSWSGTLNGQGFTDESVTGTASFTYSDDMITDNESGLDYAEGPLTSFTFSPNPIGDTTYDLSNTAFYLTFNESGLYQIIVGGTVGTAANGVGANIDDFYVVENLTSNDFLTISVADYNTSLATVSNGEITNANIDFTATQVPEPASLILLGLATAGMLSRRRRTPPVV